MTFDEFVSARLASLLRYATVLACDPHTAEDVVQEVLLRAHGRWERISVMESPEAYLRRMVLNEFLSWRRRRRPTPVEPVTLEALSTPTSDVARLDEREAVLQLLATLPPRQRAVVALRFYEGLGDDEIARLMGCRPVTVRTQASRALAALRLTAVPTSPEPALADDLGGPR